MALAKRVTRVTWVVALAALTVLPGTQAAAAQSEQERARTQLRAADTYDCTVPRFGQTRCTANFFVKPRKTVRICYQEAEGDQGADFRLIDKKLGQVGSVANLRPDDCENVYTTKKFDVDRLYFVRVGAKNVSRFDITFTVQIF